MTAICAIETFEGRLGPPIARRPATRFVDVFAAGRCMHGLDNEDTI
jgi:hypothetical protein